MRKTPSVLALGAAVVLMGIPFARLTAGEPKDRPQTVAELFGFGPEERLLILHADDAGMCHAHNRATIDGMERGVINSASIMMPCPWVLEIVEYAKAHPDADFGVHGTLTSEWKAYRWRPVTPWDQVKGLLDASGYLHRGVLETALAASAAEVETELRAQLRRALDLGLRPTHLDTHMGTVYARPDYFAAYRKVAKEFGLPCMIPRMTAEVRQKLAAPVRLVAEQIGQTLFEQGEVTLDHLDGGYPGGGGLEEQKKYYREAIRNLRPGITQIILHPAYDGDELRAITGSHARRDGDLRVFLDPDMAKFLRDQKVRMITWREIGQRQAAYRKRLAQKP
jgi:predicted glycoside hydrolase/deacetylase ChbG (UPF0249 family)